MLKTLGSNLLCVTVSILLSYLFSVHIGALYCVLSGQCAAAYPSVGFTPIVGFLLGYLFLVPFTLLSFGGSGKYWWLVIFIVPIFHWPLYLGMDAQNLGALTIVVIGGLILGTFAHKTLQKFAPSFMSKIS